MRVMLMTALAVILVMALTVPVVLMAAAVALAMLRAWHRLAAPCRIRRRAVLVMLMVVHGSSGLSTNPVGALSRT
jgi:hypothetical protein